jgi:hypothetical protein
VPEAKYSIWGSVAAVAVIGLALIGPGYAARADPNSVAIIHDIHGLAQASPSPLSSPDIVGLAPTLPLPEPAPVVAVAPSPEQSQPTGGGGGGAGGGGSPPPPPPACKPSIPGSISASAGTIARNSYDGNSGSWTVSETVPMNTDINISISGMVGCGSGLHHTLRGHSNANPSNFGCYPTMGSSASITVRTWTQPDTISVTVMYDSGCP